ncbi:hypothetical protein PENTCL1PPCAC_5147, partial [Pristionchus entomophagus]
SEVIPGSEMFGQGDSLCLSSGSNVNDGLRVAHQCASECYKTMRRAPGTSYEDRFVLEMSALVLEAIDCIEKNENIESSSFNRVSCYVSATAQSPLLKLGFCLTKLLAKLLHDRSITPAVTEAMRIPQASIKDGVITFDDSTVIKEEPLDEEMDGPVDIKIECADDIKQEEEPFVDVFCPTTGSSRPMHHRGLGVINEAALSAPIIMSKSKEIIKVKGAGARVNSTQWSNKFTSPKHECYLCGQMTDKFYATPNLNLRRATFLASIVTKTPKGRERVAELRTNNDQVFFCQTHFTAPLKKTQSFEERMAEKLKFKKNCDLCADPQFPCRFSPKHPTSAARFFDSLVDITPEQREKIEWFLANQDQRACICMKHIKTVDHYNQLLEPPQEFDLMKTTLAIVNRREARKIIEVNPSETKKEVPKLVVLGGEPRPLIGDVLVEKKGPMRTVEMMIDLGPKLHEEPIKSYPLPPPAKRKYRARNIVNSGNGKYHVNEPGPSGPSGPSGSSS